MTVSQKTFSVYTIDDHPNPGKVYDWMRTHWDIGDNDLYEAIATLKAFCDYFNLQALDYCLGVFPDRGEFIRFKVGADIEEMRGVRLWKYLSNNYWPVADDGVFWDAEILQPMADFMAAPDDRTWRELANDCASALVTALHAECKYRHSDEALRGDCEANGYQFYESGEIA